MTPSTAGPTRRPTPRRHPAPQARTRRGWATITIGVVLASAGLILSTQSSFAAENTPGQTTSGGKARVTWNFPGTPEIVFADGERSPSVMAFDAPGYAPVTEFTTLYSKTKALGYCLEPGVIGAANTYDIITPSEYLNGSGGAPERYAAQNFGKISWIAQNAYPGVDAATFARISGVRTTNHYDLYNGAQAAIWHFTNGFTLTSGSPWTIDVYKWLVSNAKDVPTSSPAAQLTASPTSATKQLGAETTLVGPITLKGSATVSDLKVSGSMPPNVTLTNAKGEALPATLTMDTEIYAKVPAGSQAGSITLTISGQGSTTPTPMVVVGTDVYGLGKAQARILSGQGAPAPVSTTATLSWTSAASPVPNGSKPQSEPEKPAQPSQPIASITPAQRETPAPAPTRPPAQSQPARPAAQDQASDSATNYQERPQRPSLPKTGVDDQQTLHLAIIGLGMVLIGFGGTMLSKRRPRSLRRH